MFKLLSIFLIIFNLQKIKALGTEVKICTCNLIDKLNFVPQKKTKIICSLSPQHGSEIRILVNSEYDVKCLQKSKIYCPAKDNYTSNYDISSYPTNLKYKIDSQTVNGKNIISYNMTIDKYASDIYFLCYIKQNQVSEFLHAIIKVDLKREVKEEFSKVTAEGVNYCDFSKGNLNISPSYGFYYKNDRSVNCIYRVIPNKPFLIKLPKLDIIVDKILPSVVNCLSEHQFINFALKYIEESDNSINFHINFGDFTKNMNLSCSMDLSEYVLLNTCGKGRKGNVIFLFNP